MTAATKRGEAPGAPTTLVCPVDFSPASRVGVLHARELAVKLGARLRIVHAYQIPSYAVANPDLDEALADQARDALQNFLADIDLGDVDVTHDIRVGVSYVEIMKAAAEIPDSAIVMSTIGRTGLEYMLLGSVAERVVRTATVPVYTVRVSPRS